MTPPSLTPESPSADAAALQRMSSLADGDLAGLQLQGGVAAALSAWRTDVQAQQAWHACHLIGDVLRSEDLAQTPAQDLTFLHRLREKLDAEPVHVPAAAVVATAPVQPRSVRTHPAGFALAASVAVAAVALWVSQPWAPKSPDDAPVLASVAGTAAGPAAAAPALAVNSAGVLRDPRLDEFLRLHQMARGGLPVSAPGGSLQRADLQMPVGAGR